MYTLANSCRAGVFLLILVSMALTGCSSMKSDIKNFDAAYKNFIYTPDPTSDPRIIYTSVDYPFVGDCEDFAFTLQRKIGGEVMYVLHNESGPHAVLEKHGLVFDNLYRHPMPKEKYPAMFIQEMTWEGRGMLIDNSGGGYRLIYNREPADNVHFREITSSGE